MAAFREERREAFNLAIVARARVEMPSACAGHTDEVLLALLRGPTRAAPRYGIVRSADVARYGLLVLRIGRDPAGAGDPLATILYRPDLVGSAKLAVLESAVGA
jgi:hypothetical protein